MLTLATFKHHFAGSLASASFSISPPDVTKFVGRAGAPPPLVTIAAD